MLNILYVYYEPMPAGQTAHVLALVRGLDRSRYHITVVLPAGLQQAVAAFQQAGATVVPLPLRKLVWPPAAVTALFQLVRQGDIDIVHVHSQEAGIPARAVARMAGARRIIYTPQTIDIRQSRWHWLYATTERALARLTDTIVSVNESDRERLIRWGLAPCKVVTISNGIDLNVFDATLKSGRTLADVETLCVRQELGVDAERPLVMQVGGLRAQKAPLAFVEGALRVVRERPNVQFVLIGEGPLKETVRARILELGLQRHVHLAGWREGACRLMPAADVVTLTSHWEGMPHTLLEAMAGSRPVVATAVNGCPEIVVDGVTGFLVPAGDPAAWARRVVDLVDDPVMANAMGRRGRKRVEERFSLFTMIAQIERLYTCACGTLAPTANAGESRCADGKE